MQDWPTPDFRRQMANPAMFHAGAALYENRLADAEPILRSELKRDPFNVVAMRMMAELAARIGRLQDAENLLSRAVELAPGFLAARSNLATVLYRQNRSEEAIAVLDALAEFEPDHLGNINLKAAALGKIGDYEEALTLYAKVLDGLPDQPKIWMSYGHLLKTVGRQQDCVAAYREAITLAPTLGEVWWSLANLKTYTFSVDDIAAMESALETSALSLTDRFHLHFALGRAYEIIKKTECAFDHYAKGNELRSKELAHDPDEVSAHVDAACSLFTTAYFEARKGWGCGASDPIFILGMPRAGSTLIEQILASHSQVEGTMELPDIPALFKRFGAVDEWPKALQQAPAEQIQKLGEAFLERTQVQRKTDKPFFIDKLPNNWMSVGFILTILPNARIIDARRHPLDCCFSNFKQHFARGQAFSYSLDHMGLYYLDYVRMMDHFEAVLPGRILRVIHEQVLDDPEGQIRQLLAGLDLPFEDDCLEFHKNDRAVRTASSEQVRKPINRDGADQWVAYDQWLDPLKAALGPALTYP
jgi:tetratricopeptide (TPR) repeat protein